MRYAHTIILTIVLVTIFCCLFGWCLMKSCRRIIDAEMQELEQQSDLEAQTAVTNVGSGTVKSKSKSAKGSKKSGGAGGSKADGKAGSKADSKEGSKAGSKDGNKKESKAESKNGEDNGVVTSGGNGGGGSAVPW